MLCYSAETTTIYFLLTVLGAEASDEGVGRFVLGPFSLACRWHLLPLSSLCVCVLISSLDKDITQIGSGLILS
jgi:hypothetical protein